MASNATKLAFQFGSSTALKKDFRWFWTRQRKQNELLLYSTDADQTNEGKKKKWKHSN